MASVFRWKCSAGKLTSMELAPPTETSEVNNARKRFIVVFENSTTTCFIYTAMVLGQPVGLYKEEYLHASADWLNSSVSQRAARGQ